MAELHYLVDFETRSPLDIKKVGMFRYMEEASPLCVAFKQIGDDPIFVDTIDFVNHENYLPQIKKFIGLCKNPEVIWHAHNAQFEMLCFAHLICKRYKLDRIPISRFRCTAAACRMFGLPGELGQAGEALQVPVLKDKEGQKVMLRLSKPKGFDALGDAEYHPATPEEMKPVIDYCIQDVLAEEAIYEVVGSLPYNEQQAWILDWQINAEGVPIDTDLCKAALQTWEVYQEKQNKRLSEITNGEITSYTQPARIPTFAAKFGVHIAAADAETIDKALQTCKVPEVLEVLQIRRDTAKTSIAKFDKMLEVLSENTRARGCHIYHGASTGRWAGALIQLQNIARGKLSPSEIETWIAALLNAPGEPFLELCEFMDEKVGNILSSLIRSAIRSREKFLIADFAGIEARGVAWLFGQDDLVSAFRDNKDIYKEFAGENIYNVPVDQVNKDQRFVGKQAILGCGYQMGAERFQQQCEGYGVQLDLEFCRKVIQAYRIRYQKISNGWRVVEGAAVQAVKAPGVYTACNKRIAFQQITIQGRRFLSCTLPSKRQIFYPEPDLEPGRFGNDMITFAGLNQETRKWTRENTYGGKITENIVQAICRDLLVGSLFRLRDAGYEPVMHVHDEIICEVPKRSPKHTVGGMGELMKIVPKWAEGFPIAVEGFEATRYRK